MSKLDELLAEFEKQAAAHAGGDLIYVRDFQREYDLLRSALREMDGHNALLKEIASANIIFPSLCANNNKAYEIIDKLAEFRGVK